MVYSETDEIELKERINDTLPKEIYKSLRK